MARPTSYDPSYCERVIDFGREGMSVVEMAAEIGVHRETLEQNWPAAFPEFSEAFTQARQLSQAWWERQGRMNLLIPQGGGSFQASVWSRSMAARFPADWRESTKTEVVADVKHDHTHRLPDETRRFLDSMSTAGSNPSGAAPVSD